MEQIGRIINKRLFGVSDKKEITMYTAITVSNNTLSFAKENFRRFHRQGLTASLWAKLSGESPYLRDFKFLALKLRAGRKYLGLKAVPVDQIIGSVNRSSDFDRHFRPLKAELCDRWIEIYQRANNGSWPPITVYKVGETYYVEDGHHRVSVANFLGMDGIQAEVWEYSTHSVQAEVGPTAIRQHQDKAAVTSSANG
jgi:hypothetical protein